MRNFYLIALRMVGEIEGRLEHIQYGIQGLTIKCYSYFARGWNIRHEGNVGPVSLFVQGKERAPQTHFRRLSTRAKTLGILPPP